ncbi:uncharacterized protein LOC127715474 [Mytilus californianus]|uniref:uncharacterized protein LOC127715474 n=1 Tax=Mytilus californianus TaxID=6549 RepID=UPI0022452141|nr:uncharacterized protein LOC127715474 [Mytilus californianus]
MDDPELIRLDTPTRDLWPPKDPNEEVEEEDEESEEEDEPEEEEQPYVKFRRMARAVKMLIHVCHVCKSLLVTSVSQESWFALLDNLIAVTTLQQSQKKGREFVRLVQNGAGKFMQLTFDLNDYKQQKQTEGLFTDEIRDIMRQRPGTRKQDKVDEVVKCLKSMSKQFREYPFTVQRKIVQYSFYDKYKHNRVILREGLAPDGIYFNVSGTLITKPEGRKNTEEIHPGDKFGEEDLICGCARRSTVITRHEVELLFLHRFDYMDIFDMAADSNDEKNLEICKKNEVLRHFPLEKLAENPGTWSVLKYKYGRLMVKDSNDVEWIYVIKSGEARVLSYLKPEIIDISKRRKEIQKMMQMESPFYRKKKLLNFIAGRDSTESAYKSSNYHPGQRRGLVSAPPTYGHRRCLEDLAYKSFPETPRNYQTLESVIGKREPLKQITNDVKLPKLQVINSARSSKGRESDDCNEENDTKNSAREPDEKTENEHVTIEDIKPITESKTSFYQKTGTRNTVNLVPRAKSEMSSLLSRSGSRMKLEKSQYESSVKSLSERQKSVVKKRELPPFVQVEVLHPGQSFGLLSLLEPSQRGPSVSLVSGECEVLAINKKFFNKNCDDAMKSLIILKEKPFPPQQELVDRLDISMQWDEFKQDTVKEFIDNLTRMKEIKR